MFVTFSLRCRSTRF
ncbi:hypothetical protein YPPY98_2976, partial [Yersinia pestis PY-98]